MGKSGDPPKEWGSSRRAFYPAFALTGYGGQAPTFALTGYGGQAQR